MNLMLEVERAIKQMDKRKEEKEEGNKKWKVVEGRGMTPFVLFLLHLQFDVNPST